MSLLSQALVSYSRHITRPGLLVKMTKIITTVILITSPFIMAAYQPNLPKNEPLNYKDFVVLPTVVTTESKFIDKKEVVASPIPFETEYVSNSDMEYGREEVVQEGVNGTLAETFLVSFWKDEEAERSLINTETRNPVTKMIEKGTKIIWKTLSTDEYGDLDYWYKLNVFATSYDGNCSGCRGLTYSGTPVKKGVCAVDPNTIPLGTNFYVEGYGHCRSEDIGGAIKGNRVDLGFEDIKNGFWSARYTNVYLLTNSPH